MLQTQFSRLKNIATQSSYRYNTIDLNQQNITHFKSRLHQIQNEFDLLDYEKKGILYRGQIEAYLQKKYQWVNKKVLNELFNTIDWKRMDRTDDLYVTRQQFCTKYLKRQKQLFYEYSKLQSQQKWFNSLYNIYQQTVGLRPTYYVSAQIQKLQFYNNFTEEFVNIDIRYEDHEEKLEFDIKQSSYDITKPSYELILPAQQSQFFLSYNFTNVRDHTIIYGNSYISINLKSNKVLRDQQLNLEVRKNGSIVGRCRVVVSLQNNSEIIRQKLKQKSAKINQNLKQIKDVNMTLGQLKQKEYEYIQFLWGIKHMPSQKIEEQDVTLVIVLRTILIVLLGGLGLVVHVLGRCEPLSIICVFLMLKWRTYVILKVEIFFMAWIIIAAMLLDGIWLVFSSHHVSQINYLNLSSAMILTYFLLGVKVLFFIYLLAFEKPFARTNQPSQFSMDKNNQLN